MRYGENDWVFLRELVQNSRDAGADLIQFDCSDDGNHLRLTCLDNGSGMSASDIQNYLLNLFASSKEQAENSLGFFGVGFWSVLRFNPTRIEVHSKKGGQATAIAIEPKTDHIQPIRPLGLDHQSSGTQIVLVKPKASEPASNFQNKVQEQLEHFAPHIHGPTGKRNLRLLLGETQINRPLITRSHSSYFKGKGFECSVDIGETSSFSLYHCGLLIRQCKQVDELFLNRNSPPLAYRPVIHLNIFHATPLMDRRSIYEDAKLLAILDQVDRKCLRLHRRLIDRSFPMTLSGRLQRWYKLWAMRAILILLALFAVYGVANQLGRHQASSPTLANPPSNHSSDSGLESDSMIGELNLTTSQLEAHQPSEGSPESKNQVQGLNSFQVSAGEVGSPSEAHAPWGFQYRPNDPFFFSLGLLDPKTLQPEPRPTRGDLSPFMAQAGAKSGSPLLVQCLVHSSSEPFLLPHPSGWTLREPIVRHSNSGQEDVFQDRQGRPYILPTHDGWLEYELIVATNVHEPVLEEVAEIENQLPRDLLDFINAYRDRPIAERIDALQTYIATNYRYEHERLARPEGSTWLDHLQETKRGDCDTLNGLAAQVLHAWGIPNELHFGLVGLNGRAETQLHAWLRVFDARWYLLDMSLLMDASADRSASLAVPQPTGSAPTSQMESSMPGRLIDAPTQGEDLRWSWIHFKSLAALGVLMILIPTTGFFLWRRRRNERQPRIRPEQLADLFVYQLDNGQTDDSDLPHRPIFRTIEGRRISLDDLMKRLPNGVISDQPRNPKRTESKKPALVVLDEMDPYFKSMKPFLPTIFSMASFRKKESDFEALKAQFQFQFPKKSLSILRGETGFWSYSIAFEDGDLGCSQFVIGEKSLPLEIRENKASRRDIRHFFETLEAIIENTN